MCNGVVISFHLSLSLWVRCAGRASAGEKIDSQLNGDCGHLEPRSSHTHTCRTPNGKIVEGMHGTWRSAFLKTTQNSKRQTRCSSGTRGTRSADNMRNQLPTWLRRRAIVFLSSLQPQKRKRKKNVSKLIRMKIEDECRGWCACASRIITQSKKSNRLCAIKNHVLSLYTMYNHHLRDQLMSQPTHRLTRLTRPVCRCRCSRARSSCLSSCSASASPRRSRRLTMTPSSSCHGNFAL